MKAWMNYWVDVAIALSFVVAGVSGVVLWPLLGLVATHDYVLGLHILTWSVLHNWGGIIMTAGVLLHLVLHWRWIVSMTRRAMSRAPQPAVRGRQPVGRWARTMTRPDRSER